MRDSNDPTEAASAEAPSRHRAIHRRVVARCRALAQRVAPPGSWVAVQLGRLGPRLWLLALFPCIAVVYAYFASAGWLRDWPVWGGFHDLQADAFRAGQIALLVDPPPELLKAKNPYDRANIRYWMLDVSLYHGKYYIYWGPVPALFQALGKSLLGVRGFIGDQYVALFSLCVGAWSGGLLIDRMARRLFAAIPRLLVVLGILALAFANPALHAASTLSTYYTAIVSGQAWLLAGLVPAFEAVWRAGTPDARRRHLLLAGLGWSLAIASRVSLLAAVAGLIGVTALLEGWPAERRWRRIIASAFWLGLPVAITGVLLLVYNELRFDNYLEFGTGVQLSGYPTLRFSSEYVLANLYSYAMRPFEWSCRFPYAFQEWWLGVKAFPKGFPLASDYMVHEPVVGWLWAVPLCWLMPLALVFAPRPFSLRERTCRVYLWCLGAFAVLASVTGLIVLGVYGATMRYLGDVTNGIVLFSLLGAFAFTSHRFGRALPKLTLLLCSVPAVATIVFGLLLGYQGYGGQFTKNPKLDAKYVKTLSFCGKRDVKVPRYVP